MSTFRLKHFLLLLLIPLFSACAPTPTLIPSPTPSLPPTETSLPLALSVNGEGILQTEFDAELARYLQVQVQLGVSVTPEQALQTLQDEYIAQLLLTQAAAQNGYLVDDTLLQQRIDALIVQLGSPEALAEWHAANGYTDAEFRATLRRQVAAAWMRDQVIAVVSTVAEQVHVKQILFYNEQDAQNVYALLQAGASFETVAGQYDPLTKGELGWFPRGYLVHPAIEQAAFALDPGEYSPVVQSSVGYHLLYLVERDPQHPLSPDALLTLQEHALQDWLAQKRAESSIVIGP